MPTPQRTLPIYIQIANHYRDAVLNGDLKPGTRLPTIAEIAEQWNVSAGTASRAVGHLQVEGVIYTSTQGSYIADGDVVSRTPSERVRSARRIRTNGDLVEVTAAGIVRAPNYVAELLGVGIGEDVIRREEITWHNGHPRMLGVDWIPGFGLEIAAGDLVEATPIKGGTIEFVERATRRAVTCGRDHLRGRAADVREASALRLPIGSPVLAGVHLLSDEQGVILYGEWVMPPDQVISYDYFASEGEA